MLYRYQRNGKELGPIDLKGLWDSARMGRLLPQDPVIDDQRSGWIPAGDHPDIKGAFTPNAPNSPPVAPASVGTPSFPNESRPPQDARPTSPDGGLVGDSCGLALKSWDRMWARFIDEVLFIHLIFSLFAGAFLFASGGMREKGDAQVAGCLISLLGFYAVEPILFSLIIAVAGTTPGKALFGIRVVQPDGTRIGFSEAISREYRVLFQGMWGRIPLVYLYPVSQFLSKLKSEGIASWDKGQAYLVTQKPRGIVVKVLRVMVIVVAFIIWAAISIANKSS